MFLLRTSTLRWLLPRQPMYKKDAYELSQRQSYVWLLLRHYVFVFRHLSVLLLWFPMKLCIIIIYSIKELFVKKFCAGLKFFVLLIVYYFKKLFLCIVKLK